MISTRKAVIAVIAAIVAMMIPAAAMAAPLNSPPPGADSAYSQATGGSYLIGIDSHGDVGTTSGSAFVFNYNSSSELVVASNQLFAGKCIFWDQNGTVFRVETCNASAAADQWSFGSNFYTIMRNGYLYPRGNCPFDGEGGLLYVAACNVNDPVDRWHWQT